MQFRPDIIARYFPNTAMKLYQELYLEMWKTFLANPQQWRPVFEYYIPHIGHEPNRIQAQIVMAYIMRGGNGRSARSLLIWEDAMAVPGTVDNWMNWQTMLIKCYFKHEERIFWDLALVAAKRSFDDLYLN